MTDFTSQVSLLNIYIRPEKLLSRNLNTRVSYMNKTLNKILDLVSKLGCLILKLSLHLFLEKFKTFAHDESNRSLILFHFWL